MEGLREIEDEGLKLIEALGVTEGLKDNDSDGLKDIDNEGVTEGLRDGDKDGDKLGLREVENDGL